MFLIFLTDHAEWKITEFSKELSQMHYKNVHMDNKLEIEAHFLLLLKKSTFQQYHCKAVALVINLLLLLQNRYRKLYYLLLYKIFKIH